MDFFKRMNKNRTQQIATTDSPVKTDLINYFNLYNKRDEENLLHIAVSLGRNDLVREIVLNDQVDVDIVRKSGDRPPLLIGLQCYKRCISFLEDLNTESGQTNERLNDYCSLSVKENDTDFGASKPTGGVLNITLDIKNDIPNISFPLEYSYSKRSLIIKDYEECILFLISQGASTKSKDEAKNTPLIVASNLGLTTIVNAMLMSKNKCKLNHTNIYYETALHKAATNQHYEIIKSLLSAGASTTGKTNNFYDGDTPLECMIRNVHKCGLNESTSSIREEIIKEMIQKSKKHYTTTQQQWNLMSRAAKHGDTQTILILLDMNFPINFHSPNYETALGVALTNRQREVTELLLEKGVDPNERINGRIPINLAVKSQDIENVKSLILYGGNQDHKKIITIETMTFYQGILHICLDLGCDEIADLLYTSGVVDIGECYRLLEKTKDSQPYYEWLKDTVESPLSLRCLTRIKILKSLRPFPYFRVALNLLDIPEVLRSFLSFRPPNYDDLI
ncbi:hypothetical protein LOTGIDRAFT_229595 [Lottia gigantea]|uniref:Uncharacterized protein n=1 Tax=Lottia gigantea TaxID=225164 RepID=V3ZNM8_LOTGI|nr:hypothetical protein LOTGIDRAFT_229595 [Lottia gigantea]ESO84085.1 hypothetical protein LOTGIDRAFT_229595 [Lottia gigantea]